jgi:hypothetical protein
LRPQPVAPAHYRHEQETLLERVPYAFDAPFKTYRPKRHGQSTCITLYNSYAVKNRLKQNVERLHNSFVTNLSVHGEIGLHADSVQNSPKREEVSFSKRTLLQGVTFVPGIKLTK